jgi:glucans biosynthesis protein
MRLHLTFAIITALLLFATLRRDDRHLFTFADVEKLARQRSAAVYTPLQNALPPQLKSLNAQQEQGIFWKDAYRLWRKKGLPFQVDFYHISKAFPSGPRINTVDRKGAHPLAYSPSFFDFSGLIFKPPLPSTLPYAGFYLRYPLPTATETKPNVLNGFFTTQGASYFRVLAQNQVYGLSARALAIDTALGPKQPEEFPEFTDWWLEEPAPTATELSLDAILDSPSVTGAYAFKIKPGGVTSVDVHAVLFFRRDVARLGVAPFSSMYLYGENAKNHFGDTVHPEIHDSDGMLLQSGKGVWTWRPLQQQPMLQLYNFADENPKGFGLLQRDRNFSNYQDLAARYNVRPSAWVIPHGTWGKGAVQVTQLPTNNTNTDNVVLFWRPDQSPKAGDRLVFDYTIDFYMNDAGRPPLAYCRATFINDPAPPPSPAPSVSPGSPPSLATVPPEMTPAPAALPKAPSKKPAPIKPVAASTTPVQFLLDFIGNGIEGIPAGSVPDLDLAAEPTGTVVRESKVEKNGYDNSWRVTFTIIPWKHNVPTELHCRLFPHDSISPRRRNLEQIQAQIAQAQAENDAATVNRLQKNDLPQQEEAVQDALGRPLTETWTYTWHQ